MFKEYDVRLISRVYQTPYLVFHQDWKTMTAQVCEHRPGYHRTGDVCLAWVSFAEEGAWSKPELVLWAKDDGSVQISAIDQKQLTENFIYYRVYPEEIHSSILAVIEERKSA